MKGFLNVDLIEKPKDRSISIRGCGGMHSRVQLYTRMLAANTANWLRRPSAATTSPLTAQGSQMTSRSYILPPIQPPKPSLTGAEIIIARVFKAYGQAIKELGIEFKDVVNPLEPISSTINTIIMSYAPKDRHPLEVDIDGVHAKAQAYDALPDDLKKAYEQAANGEWPKGIIMDELADRMRKDSGARSAIDEDRHQTGA